MSAVEHIPDARRQGAVVRSIVRDGDAYERSVRGVTIEATRLGVGVGPNEVQAAVDGEFVATSSRIGFPIAVRSTVPDDRLVIASMGAVPAGSRWSEVDLRPGSTMVYAPGSEHMAINLPGLRFTFTVVEAEDLGARADVLGMRWGTPERGQVSDFIDRPGASAVADDLLSIPSLPGGVAPASHQDELLTDVASMLAGAQPIKDREPPRRLDRRRVVARCIDYADSIERLPTTSELCLASGASARTVRRAFVSVFGVPPMTYFRSRALTRAHRLLSSEGPRSDSVTSVAARLGFTHLGRFSWYYRRVHGENPSATLRAQDATEGPTVD